MQTLKIAVLPNNTFYTYELDGAGWFAVKPEWVPEAKKTLVATIHSSPRPQDIRVNLMDIQCYCQGRYSFTNPDTTSNIERAIEKFVPYVDRDDERACKHLFVSEDLEREVTSELLKRSVEFSVEHIHVSEKNPDLLFRSLGQRLFRVALKLSRKPDAFYGFTVKEIKAAVGDSQKKMAKSGPRQGWTLAIKRDACAAAAKIICRFRNQRDAHTGRRQLSQRAVVFSGSTTERRNRLAVNMFHHNLGQRYIDFRQQQFTQVVRQSLRCDPSGDYSLKVKFKKGKGPFTAKSEVTVGEAYSGRSPYRKKDVTHEFAVPHNWLSTVKWKGLANIGGMMTLSAIPVAGVSSIIEIYKASWVAQGRGFSFNAHRGYIARHGNMNYHGNTLEKALDGFKRKYGSLGAVDKFSAEKMEGRKKRVMAIRKNYGMRPVTLTDAFRLNLCDTGIESWCNLIGLDTDLPCTLADVIDGYLKHPVDEALTFILHFGRMGVYSQWISDDEQFKRMVA